jgi:hypothetical protein
VTVQTGNCEQWQMNLTNAYFSKLLTFFSFTLIDGLYVCLEYRDEFGDCWPLDAEQVSIIRKNKLELAELLDLDTDDDLIGAIYSKSYFLQQQLTSIQSVSDLRKRNMKLLDILTRSSRATFNRFVDCLRTTQRHIVPLLTGNKGKQLV